MGPMIAPGATVELVWSALRRLAALLCVVALLGTQWGALPATAVPLAGESATLAAPATAKPFIQAPSTAKLGTAEWRAGSPAHPRQADHPPIVALPSVAAAEITTPAGATKAAFTRGNCLPQQRPPFEACGPPVGLS
jgi:hypothetical protein